MSHGVTNQIEKTGKGNIEYSDHSSKSEILNNICVSCNSSQPTNKPNLTSLKPEEIPLNKLGLEFFPNIVTKVMQWVCINFRRKNAAIAQSV